MNASVSLRDVIGSSMASSYGPSRRLPYTASELACETRGTSFRPGGLQDVQEALHLHAIVLAGGQASRGGNEEVANGGRLVLPNRVHQQVRAVQVHRFDEDALSHLVREKFGNG